MTTVLEANLKLKTFCSRRLNSDREDGILGVNVDVRLFVLINTEQLVGSTLTASFSVTWWSC